MPDPNVYEVGRVEDIHGRPVVVKVNYDGVDIGDWTFTCTQVADFARVLEAAWLAARAAQQEASDA